MSIFGLNIDATLPVDDSALIASGAEWFRAPLRLDSPGPATVERLIGKGLKYLGVVDRTTVSRPRSDYDAVYRATFPTMVAAVQIGNEWDHVGPSSWTLTRARLLALRDEWQGFAPVTVMGGMADGRPSVLTPKLAAAFDFAAFQPYGRRPAPNWPSPTWGFGFLGDLADGYAKAAPSAQFIVSEFGCTISEMPSERPRFYAETLRLLLAHRAIGGAFPFGLNNGGGGGASAYHLGAAEIDTMREVLAEFPNEKGKDGVMKLEELADQHGGIYGKPVVISGTAANPKARIAFLNDKPGRFALEINGEADGPYDRGNA